MQEDKKVQIEKSIQKLNKAFTQFQSELIEPHDYEKYFEHLNVAAELIYIIDYQRNEIVFSKGFDAFLGFPKPIKSLVELYKLVHPDDIDEVATLTAIALKTGSNVNDNNAKKTHFVLDYRLRKASGEYVRILRQSSIINASTERGMISTVSICTDISNLKMTGPVDFRFTGKGEENFYKMVEKEKAVISGQRGLAVLSIREQEILHLISQGFRSQDIAEKLHVSVHTVNTHRRNMLKKLEVKTMAELMIKVLV